jgi:hypothetical protein
MTKKRATFNSVPLEHRWQSKVRTALRKARNSRERADMWGHELTRYLGRLSI